MKNLSTFIWHDNEYYYDTLFKTKSKVVPLVSNNLNSVQNKLFGHPKRLQLTLISTWSCNLRCAHCFVLKKLNKKLSPENINIKLLEKFINWHIEKYNTKEIVGLIIGGEPLLYTQNCIDYISIIKKYGGYASMTTNLSLDFTKDFYEIFKLLDSCQVSLDGSELVHNASRHIYNKQITHSNVFVKVIENLKIIKNNFDISKIHVSISIRKDVDSYKDTCELVFLLKSLGLSQITVSYISESSYFKKTKENSMTAMKEMPRPCCSFRYMEHFVMSGNNISSDYFDKDSKTILGTLDMPNYNDIEIEYKNVINDTMPILKDETCLSCRALPICWGQCVGHTLFDNFIPSKFCDQQKMTNKMDETILNKDYLSNFKESCET